MNRRPEGPFSVFVDAPEGGITLAVETLSLGDAFAQARQRDGFVVDANRDVLQGRRSRRRKTEEETE